MLPIKFQIHSLPINTPKDAVFYLAGNFNQWAPKDPNFCFEMQDSGLYELNFETDLTQLECKVTRGDWSTSEGDDFGRTISNRVFQAGAENNLYVQVNSWVDMPPKHPTGIVRLLHPNMWMPQLERNRRIWACFPPDYWMDTKKRYPVVYMQDGQNLFDNPDAKFGSWDIDKAMHQLFLKHPNLQGQAPILIGIENGASHRIDEYAPWVTPEHGGGEGAAYLEFICNTLKPFVDQQLRTRPEQAHTGIIGSSMGGLFSLYAILEKPAVFGMAGVFSPALWFSENLFDWVKTRKPSHPVKILLMAGQQESEEMVGQLLDLYEVLLEAGYDEDLMHYDLHSDGTHSEHFWAREFEHALAWLLGGMPGHSHGISDEMIQFGLDAGKKELLIKIAPRLQHAQLEVRDYCHNRQFKHDLGQIDNRVPYADWEECIFSIRMVLGNDLVFSRRVPLNQV